MPKFEVSANGELLVEVAHNIGWPHKGELNPNYPGWRGHKPEPTWLVEPIRGYAEFEFEHFKVPELRLRMGDSVALEFSNGRRALGIVLADGFATFTVLLQEPFPYTFKEFGEACGDGIIR